MKNIREEFGDIDIYVFDQIQKGRFTPGMKIFDAGCGGGRNIVWFLRNGFDVSAIDVDDSAVTGIREIAKDSASGAFSREFSGRIAWIDPICG